MRKYARAITIHVILPLLAGFLIYLFFRTDTWLHHLLYGRGSGPAAIRPVSTFSGVLAFNVPDFCWSYSFSSALFIWEQWQGWKIKILPLALITGLILSELLQYFLSSSFTFDWRDVVAAVAAFMLSYYQFRKNAKI